MFLVVGLGNPNIFYALNRHNFGFMALDVLADNYNFSKFTDKFDGLWSEGKIGTEKVYALKPMTFMNLSGKSVAAAANFYKIPLANIIVIHDDLDLELGKIKAKKGGSSAGHNGLKSIDSCMGGNNYTRVRLGIGHPPSVHDVSSYVLSNFSKTEMEEVPFVLQYVAAAFPALLTENTNRTEAFTTKIALYREKS